MTVPAEYTAYLEPRGFRVEGRIGSGLSGTVVKAIQTRLGRPVAVKFVTVHGVGRMRSLEMITNFR